VVTEPALVPRYTLNSVNAEPPFAGMFHDRSTKPFPRVAVNDGAAGTVAGVADWTVDRVSPTPFTAATWKKYCVPFVSPVL
jgi:hypothetical protein